MRSQRWDPNPIGLGGIAVSLLSLRTQWEDSPRKTALTRNPPSWHPDLGLAASRTLRNRCLLFKSPSQSELGQIYIPFWWCSVSHNALGCLLLPTAAGHVATMGMPSMSVSPGFDPSFWHYSSLGTWFFLGGDKVWKGASTSQNTPPWGPSDLTWQLVLGRSLCSCKLHFFYP